MNTFIFLAGLTIENLLKGIILIGYPGYVKDGKLSKSIHTHDLLKLAKLATITLTKEEESLSEILGESITSFGRYPIPLDISKLKEKMTIKYYIKEAYDNFYTRLMQETLLRYEKINLEIDKTVHNKGGYKKWRVLEYI
jgi:hypothetical protein